MSVTTDYYAALGVRRDANADEIKMAFRRLARELHPDVNPDLVTQERFKEITQAYEVLSDPDKRQMYDLGRDAVRWRRLVRWRRPVRWWLVQPSPQRALGGGRVSPKPPGVASGTMATARFGWCLESVPGSRSLLGLHRRAAAVVFTRLAGTPRGQATPSPAIF